MGAHVLLVDDEHGLREMLRVLLTRAGYQVSLAQGLQSGLATLTTPGPLDVVVTDLAMPDGSGMDVLAAARRKDANLQVIMVTAYATTEQAVQAMRQGAYDYIQKPFKNAELLAVIEKAVEKKRLIEENSALKAQVAQGGLTARNGPIVGKSHAMEQVMRLVQRVASAPSSVLVTGESGTGKEMIARALHEAGERRAQAFVAINCAALPEALLESELFGHEKGAFTGAERRKDGLFRTADGGTLFLDEIGELPLALQVKLLRALQERRIRPVGGDEERPVDVRVVAATNRDLEHEVQQGRFREDLYYRLNVINLHLPPLRERPEDIPPLAEHFLAKHGRSQGKQLSFTPEALRCILGRSYKGNVRELENVVERAVTLALGEQITAADLNPMSSREDGLPMPWPMLPQDGLDLDKYLADVEQQLLVAALARTHGVRKDAAQLLKTTFRSFRYRLAKYGLAEDEAATDV